MFRVVQLTCGICRGLGMFSVQLRAFGFGVLVSLRLWGLQASASIETVNP